MDAALNLPPSRLAQRWGLLAIALVPAIPQLFGSAFNIWYNAAVVGPLLFSQELKDRFLVTCVLYNGLVYPVAVILWLRLVFSLKPALRELHGGGSVSDATLAPLRRRVIHLPWWGALITGAGWLLCIPIFLVALWAVGHRLDAQLLWHLPISFAVSAAISVTHSFFLVELASHWALFPVFFRDARPEQVPGAVALSFRGRGVAWAISAGICPIGSLLLLSFAPPSPGSDPQWFAVFVGSVGIAFGLATAVMITRLVAQPIDHLRAAAQAVAQGRYDTEVPLRRADEFGLLIGEFNHMIRELRDKERLRQTFGLHVGRQAAEQILARDPGLSGVEQEITVMFVDIRGFTSRTARASAADAVSMLNEFLSAMVRVVEETHGGMVNKFLGDGFVTLFGIGADPRCHATSAVLASRDMLGALEELNARFSSQGREPLAIGVGIHTGPAVVGSIGSPARLEFTAIGATVNLASRIEALTKTAGVPVLLTAATRERIMADCSFRELPPQPVRGLADPVPVFALA